MELNPFSHDFHADPYPVYRWLREEAPCYYNEELDFFALSRYDDVLAASQQPLLFSSAEGTTLERLDTAALLPMMIFMDPPRHDLHRQLVSRAFTPRAVSELEPFVRSTAVALLDELREKGGGDFVEEFSAILPMNVIFELIGVPPDDRDQLRRWMDTTLERTEDPPYIPREALEAMASSMSYWRDLLREKRSFPDGGVMSRLCEVQIETGDGPARLTDEEVIGFCSLIGSAGTETLTKLLANAVVLLQRNPTEWKKILEDRSAVGGTVEETLRYWAPSQYQGRLLTEDVVSHGRHLPAGSRVLMLTGSANRDERAYEEPDRFDVSRGAHVPLGFGHGLHFCLGAALARLEGRVGLGEFARLFPEYEIDESGLKRVHQSNVHGFSSVPFAAPSGGRN